MKLNKNILIYLIAGFVFVACKDDKDEMESAAASGNPVGIVENSHTSGQIVSADFLGRITDKNGNPVSNATVSAGGAIVQSNAQGFYKIEGAAVDGQYALVKVEASGKFDQFRALKPRENETTLVDITMIEKVVNGFFSTSSGGEVNIPGGATVSFPAGELVTSTGQPYSGEVVVASTFLDPSDPDLMSYMPGSLAAVSNEGEPVGMITYGMVGIELTGAINGQALQMAGGRKATLTLPLPESHTSHAPESIPLWYFDETAGIWQEEGSATRSGNNYVGQVSHFTFWNCDVSANTLVLEGTVFTDTGFPFSDLRVKLTRPNESFTTSMLDADGYFNGIVPANEAFTLEIIAYDCQTVFYEAQIGPFTEDTDLGNIEVQITDQEYELITLSGTMVDCDEVPAEGLFLSYEEMGGDAEGYLITDETGSFSTTIACVNQGTLIFTPTSLTELLTGASFTLSYDIADSQEYDLGQNTFCDGEAIIDYLNYSDGTNSLSFNSVEFVPADEGQECGDLNATVQGNELIEYTEGISLVFFASDDSLTFFGACSFDMEIRGFLSNGNYLVATIPASSTSFDVIQEVQDGTTSLMEAEITYSIPFNGTMEVNIYEDELSTTPLNTYQPDEVNIDFLVIYEE
jgi:hypothetical protein